MRLSQAWIITGKDFRTFIRKPNILYAIFGAPTIIALLLPAVLAYTEHRMAGRPSLPAELETLIPTFAFFYVILAGVIPTTIASYTIVGEKLEKSLEPLLATPTTDAEILLGKGLAASAPPLAAVVVSASVFMALTDAATRGALGRAIFPNGDALLLLFVMAPLAAVMSVEWNVIMSARVSDVRVAQQVGALAILPFAGLYVAGELGLVALGVTRNLLIVAACQAAVDTVLLLVATSTFRRDEILTRWR